MALPKLPPPPRIEPLPPASLLVPCTSITRSSRYPLLAPPPGAFTAPCPLPPVKPGPGEERNSWESPPTEEPYHPSGWSRRAVLPGPRLVFDSISPTDVI
ncbi:hypothetical protein EXIGLDRAFT_731473 [Exidia glandulosa HHB12029]|uniref:Uncharacterized protein n=1 Tax=Exidia glandulosa HHB12029 TaxID=1314781 RepID=A0A165L1A5_EXIGL|nr:hypothetical protein EXIGLDRAFT_731473 [Exidia glandulosa HHB12029]